MPPICFIDGARFGDAGGFLRALNQAVLGMPSADEACEILAYLRRGAGAVGSRGRPRLHLVWLNAEVSRRRFHPARGGPPISFTALTRWLGSFRDVDLILL